MAISHCSNILQQSLVTDKDSFNTENKPYDATMDWHYSPLVVCVRDCCTQSVRGVIVSSIGTILQIQQRQISGRNSR